MEQKTLLKNKKNQGNGGETMAKRDDSVKKKVPELRFKGFTDDWEERKIKDIFKITRGKVLAATETSEEKSDISPFPVYSSQTKNNGLMGYYKDYLFDTAITWTTDGANAGTVSYRSGRFYSTNVNGVLISDKGYTNKAISEILNLEAWKWVSHVGNPKLMNNVMGDISIMIPSSFEEQDRLSDFLNQLDDTIALHQRKLDLLKEQKKGFLQKMFPKNGEKVPELRFAGFADDWEERKLGEIAPLRGGFAFKSSKFRNTGVPIVRISNILSSGEVGGDFVYYDEQDKDDKYILPDKSAVLAMSGATTGKVSILSQTDYDKVYQNQRVGYFQSVENIDYGFISTIVRSELFVMQLDSVLVSGAQPNVSSKEIDSFNFMIPSYEEQQKIGSFFKQLDETIALHQRKLDLLKEQKKGFLQKMFV